MARKSAAKTPWWRKLVYLFMMLTGGSVGGYSISEHPMLARLVNSVMGDGEGEPTEIASLAKEGVGKLLQVATEPTQSGIYEVKIDRLQLDPKLFRDGQAVDMQLRVRSIDAAGAEKIAWDSADVGTQRAVVGRDDLTASWSNRPFRLGWSPGEVLVVEVYGRRGFRDTVLFRTNLENAEVFPLRSGSQTLVNLMSERVSARPEANQVVLSSKRVDDRPGTAQTARRNAPAAAESRTR